ncbi:hypothetical protein [Actinoplanes sp. G11-F43]|uniref:hypothetical protein n=1 Tax=Actinoplanes sp. G11-F43 TaxID=3424130 RepID=UPI003D32DF83
MRALRTTRLTAALTITALTLGACTGDDPDPPPPSAPAPAPSATATPSAATDDAAVRDEVLNRYRGYNAAYTRAQLAANAQDEELLSFLETPLKQNVVAFLAQTKQNGAAYRGEPQSQPTIAKVDLKATPPTVLVSDCYDATNFLLYFTKNNQPVPIKSGPRRYIIETTATDFGARGWLFTRAQSFPDRTC